MHPDKIITNHRNLFPKDRMQEEFQALWKLMYPQSNGTYNKPFPSKLLNGIQADKEAEFPVNKGM